MTNLPSTFKTKGTVSKLRLIRGTEAPPLELPNDDPYIVKGVMSFNVDGADNVEAVAEIGKRGVDYAPGTFTAQGSFVCFFQKEYFNRIIGDLLSLSFNEEGERFFAEVHYVNGFYLTVPILITNRSDSINPQNVNQVNFNFVCTDVPDYTNLAIRNIPPTAPGALALATNGIDSSNYISVTAEESTEQNSSITGYMIRYRNINSRGVRGNWRNFTGDVAAASGSVTATAESGKTFGLPIQSVEMQMFADSAAGRSPYSNTLFVAAAPRVKFSGASSAITVEASDYNLAFASGRTIRRWQAVTGANANNLHTRTKGNTATAPTSITQNAGTRYAAVRVQFTDGSYSYWALSGAVTVA